MTTLTRVRISDRIVVKSAHVDDAEPVLDPAERSYGTERDEFIPISVSVTYGRDDAGDDDLGWRPRVVIVVGRPLGNRRYELNGLERTYGFYPDDLVDAPRWLRDFVSSGPNVEVGSS